jgi:hypothetical protein
MPSLILDSFYLFHRHAKLLCVRKKTNAVSSIAYGYAGKDTKLCDLKQANMIRSLSKSR